MIVEVSEKIGRLNLGDFILSSDLKNHREHREKWHRSVLSVYSVVDKLFSDSFFKNKFKNHLIEGSESVIKCNLLQMEAADGKQYLTDVANSATTVADGKIGVEYD